MQSSNIQLNKEIMYILKLPNKLYSMQTLRKELIKNLEKKSISVYYISLELKEYLNLPNDYIDINKLLDDIVLYYSENTNRPLYDYYSYDQKPNYDNIK
jgi:hypothetical protein